MRVDVTAAVRADGADEFVILVEPELPGAYRLAGLLLGDAGEADDATCEAVARAWKSRAEVRDPAKFAAWFGRIVTNVCRDRLRRRKGVRLVQIDDGGGNDVAGGDEFREALSRDEVGRLVRKLPPDQQVVVALRFWRDMSLDEIAERVGVPLGTVKSRLYYAMRSLRAELDSEGRIQQ